MLDVDNFHGLPSLRPSEFWMCTLGEELCICNLLAYAEGFTQSGARGKLTGQTGTQSILFVWYALEGRVYQHSTGEKFHGSIIL